MAMTPEKIREVIERYRAEFVRRNIAKRKIPDGKEDLTGQERMQHCHWMLDQMLVFLEEGRREKVMRWIGFIQGVLWDRGVFDLEDLKNHSRPDGPAFVPSNVAKNGDDEYMW